MVKEPQSELSIYSTIQIACANTVTMVKSVISLVVLMRSNLFFVKI